MQHFINPHPNWTKKHGKVYCRICKDKTKRARVPTARKGVTFRKEYAACEDCTGEMIKIIDRHFYINYLESESEAAYQINRQFGVII